MTPDLKKVQLVSSSGGFAMAPWMAELLVAARNFLLRYSWCEGIVDQYVGICEEGVIGVFLFKINPSRIGVDEWIWVVVGDIPPAYLTCEGCKNPADALDGYIGAMLEWVEAVEIGNPVDGLIPVNAPADLEHAASLKKRLLMLDELILSRYVDDLT